MLKELDIAKNLYSRVLFKPIPILIKNAEIDRTGVWVWVVPIFQIRTRMRMSMYICVPSSSSPMLVLNY